MMTRQFQYQWREKKKRKRINPRHHQLPQWAAKKKRNGSSGRNSNLVDKISSLPNHLLLQILALLPTKTVVQTSILSKTWKNLWLSVDCLQFDGNLFPSITVFINFMNSFLLHRPNSSSSSYDDIEKLSLSYHGFTTDLCLATMDSCLDFAGAKNVKILEISLFHAIPSHLPNVFIFSSLRVLKLITPFVGLGGFPIKLPTSSSVFLPSLKTLHLEGLDFETDHFHSLFSASTCPVLETLYVEDCVMLRYKVMNISFPQLRNLIFLENRTRIVRSIIMSTPNLTSFKFNLDTWCNIFFTHNPPAVSNVQFSAKYIIRTDAAVISPMISFIESVGHHVEFLSLSVYKALFSQLEHGFCLPQYICVPFCNLKWLKLTTTFHACEQLMISTLLNYSPNLESLILENEIPDKAPLARKVTKSREQSWSSTTGSILSHLKMVKIHNFQACENGIKFVMFLLDNAVVLETVTIQYDHKCSKHKFEMTKIGKRLQKHPRASSSVRMVFISKPDVDGLHEVVS